MPSFSAKSTGFYSDQQNFKLEGVEELSARLKRLEEKLGRKEAVRILRKGAPPIKKEMKKLAPNRSGNLRRSIVTRRGKRGRRFGETVLVGPKLGKRGVNYAHIQELGARGGVYEAKGGRRFSFFSSSGHIIKLKRISRSATPAIRFIERAYTKKVDEATSRIQNEIIKVIQK